jgi:crossover junction endodeoxyribonuclease RuvC
MIFIGVDPSLTGTGIVASNGHMKLIETKKDMRDIDRIIYIVDETETFITNEKKKDNVVVGIEGFSFNSVGRAISQQFGLGWYLRIVLEMMRYTYYQIPPFSWKKLLFGGSLPKGVGKDLVLLRTYKAYKKEFENNNLCDAFNIMKFTEVMYGRLHNKKIKVSKIGLSTIDKVIGANKLTLDSG